MRIVWTIIGLAAALSTGFVVVFTLGTISGVVALLVVLGLGLHSARAADEPQPVLRSVLVGLLFVSLGLGVYGTATIGAAFSDTSGPVEPADPEALQAAESKVESNVADKAGFRLELTDKELTALLQNGLEEAQAPFRRVEIRVVGDGGGKGHLAFEAMSRNGKLAMRGELDVRVEAGVLQVDLRDVDMGAIRVSGAARDVVEDFVNPFAERAFEETDVELQSVRLTDGRLIIVGTRSGGQILTSDRLLASLTQSTDVSPAELPEERIGPGVVNGRQAPGKPWYVALGDSLAANVGVDEPRQGYVARFHKAVQERDGTGYGLRNFGVAGATSGSLLRHQLNEALRFIEEHEVRYITVNVGANDLLVHLASDDCSEDVQSSACEQRIENAQEACLDNLRRLFSRLRRAAPQATIIYLTVYNPFGLGLESRVAFEAQSNRVLREFNQAAAEVAESHRVLVADGFTPMQGRAAVATHILDRPPDVHPRGIGYDLLAAALVDALPPVPPASSAARRPTRPMNFRHHDPPVRNPRLQSGDTRRPSPVTVDLPLRESPADRARGTLRLRALRIIPRTTATRVAG